MAAVSARATDPVRQLPDSPWLALFARRRLRSARVVIARDRLRLARALCRASASRRETDAASHAHLGGGLLRRAPRHLHGPPLSTRKPHDAYARCGLECAPSRRSDGANARRLRSSDDFSRQSAYG